MRKRNSTLLCHSVTQSQSDTMSANIQDAVCEVCGKTVRSCINRTNLVKHLRLNHNTEYKAVMMRQKEEESTVSGAADRNYPGTEEENVEL